MPELRRGATNHRWVIVAPERARRPSDFEQKGAAQAEQAPGNCPFCAGNEDQTPPEVYRVPDGDNWHVRVIPNKFPALEDYAELGREPVDGFYDRMHGVGAHEVVVESPDHNKTIPDLPEDQVVRIVDAYIRRLKSLMENPWLRYVLLFKNHGKEAGASLHHPHSQIIATPIVPQEVRNSLNIAKAYYDRKERCLFCDIMLTELKSGERIVDDQDGFVTWAPYDARFPFELVRKRIPMTSPPWMKPNATDWRARLYERHSDCGTFSETCRTTSFSRQRPTLSCALESLDTGPHSSTTTIGVLPCCLD